MSLAASMTAQMLVAVVYKQKRIVGKINNRFKWPNGIPFIQEFLWMMFVRVTFSDSSFILKRSARDIYYTPYNSNNVLQKCYVFRVIFCHFHIVSIHAKPVYCARRTILDVCLFLSCLFCVHIYSSSPALYAVHCCRCLIFFFACNICCCYYSSLF